MITIVVHTPTCEDFVEVVTYFIIEYKMSQYNDVINKNNLKNIWEDYKHETCAYISIGNNTDIGNYIRYSERDYYKDYNILSMGEFYKRYYSNYDEILKNFR